MYLLRQWLFIADIPALLTGMCTIVFLELAVRRKQRAGWWYILFPVLYALFASLVNAANWFGFSAGTLGTLLLQGGFCCAACLLLYRGGLLRRLLAAATFPLAEQLLLWSSSINRIFPGLAPHGGFWMGKNDLRGLISYLIIHTFLLLLLLAIRQVCRRRTPLRAGALWLLALSVFVLQAAALLLANWLLWEIEDTLLLLWAVFFGALALLFLLYCMIVELWERDRWRRDYDRVSQQLWETTQSVAALQETHRAIRALSHDFREHIACLQQLLQRGQTEQAAAYLERLHEKAEETLLPVSTHNIAIDAVLNDKIMLARKDAVSLRFSVGDLSAAPLDDMSLVVLLANALNNAIEACRRLPDKRVIQLTIGQAGGRFMVRVVNPLPAPAAVPRRKGWTTKPNPQEHGFGLQNIQEVVDRYGGQLILQSEDDRFVLAALFPEQTPGC